MVGLRTEKGAEKPPSTLAAVPPGSVELRCDQRQTSGIVGASSSSMRPSFAFAGSYLDALALAQHDAGGDEPLWQVGDHDRLASSIRASLASSTAFSASSTAEGSRLSRPIRTRFRGGGGARSGDHDRLASSI